MLIFGIRMNDLQFFARLTVFRPYWDDVRVIEWLAVCNETQFTIEKILSRPRPLDRQPALNILSNRGSKISGRTGLSKQCRSRSDCSCRSHLIRIYTVYHSICIFWMLYRIVPVNTQRYNNVYPPLSKRLDSFG